MLNLRSLAVEGDQVRMPMICVLPGSALEPPERSVDRRGGLTRDQAAVEIEVRPEATASKAASRDGGRDFPRFPARRRIPRQAVAVKKNRRGTSPVSKISDKPHTTPSLGDSIWEAACSHILSVKHPPCEAVCARDALDNSRRLPASGGDFDAPPGEQAQKACKCSSSIVRKDAGDVLPDQPAGPISASNSAIGEHEAATRAIQSSSEAGDRVVLAGGSSAKKVNCCIGPLLETGHVAPIRDMRIVMGEDGGRERLDLAERDGQPAERVPRLRCRLDAGTD
jgi:hypothetical protein